MRDMDHNGDVQSIEHTFNLPIGSLQRINGTVIIPYAGSYNDREVHALLSGNKIDAAIVDDGTGYRITYKDSDILLPVVVFAGQAVISIVLNIISSWLYDKHKQKDDRSIQFQYIEVEGLTIKRWRMINGSIEDVAKIIEQESKLYQKQASNTAFLESLILQNEEI